MYVVNLNYAKPGYCVIHSWNFTFIAWCFEFTVWLVCIKCWCIKYSFIQDLSSAKKECDFSYTFKGSSFFLYRQKTEISSRFSCAYAGKKETVTKCWMLKRNRIEKFKIFYPVNCCVCVGGGCMCVSLFLFCIILCCFN